MTAKQLKALNINKDPAAEGRWKCSSGGILTALRGWPKWQAQKQKQLQERQQQQQQQRNRARQQAGGDPVAPTAGHWFGSKTAIADTASRCPELLSEVVVDGMKFVGSNHRRHDEMGWAVLKREPGSDTMWFFHISMILRHSDWKKTKRVLLYGTFHKSAAPGGSGPLVDTNLDSPIFKSATAARQDAGNQRMCVTDCDRVAAVRLAVVPHMAPRLQQYSAALCKEPDSLYMTAGFALPQ